MVYFGYTDNSVHPFFTYTNIIGMFNSLLLMPLLLALARITRISILLE